MEGLALEQEQRDDELCRQLCEAILFGDPIAAQTALMRGAPQSSKNYNAIYTSYAAMGHLPDQEDERRFYWWLRKHGQGTERFASARLHHYEATLNLARSVTVAWLCCAQKRRLTPFSKDVDLLLARLIWSTHDDHAWDIQRVIK
jgi:hypothetical protein